MFDPYPLERFDRDVVSGPEPKTDSLWSPTEADNGEQHMLIEIRSQEQARVLQIEGYSRAGGKAVEVNSIEQAKKLLDRDDTTVKKVVIERQNNEEEAALIDSYLENGQYGRFNTYTPKTPRRVKADALHLKSKSRNSQVKINEERIVAKQRFRDVLEGTFTPEPDPEDVESTMQNAQMEIRDEIKNLNDTIEELQTQHDTIADMDYEDFVEQFC